MRIWKQGKGSARSDNWAGQTKAKNLHIAHTASDGSTPHGGSRNQSRDRFLQHTVNQTETKCMQESALTI